ncbi:MAG: hypothetical protein R2710_20275 [Acidimicrobiales bacterium]
MTDTADRPSDDPSGSPLRPLADYAIGTTSGFVPVRDPLPRRHARGVRRVEDVVQTLAPLIRRSGTSGHSLAAAGRSFSLPTTTANGSACSLH